MKKIYFVF